jgi:hypothetical protein
VPDLVLVRVMRVVVLMVVVEFLEELGSTCTGETITVVVPTTVLSVGV